MRAAVARVAARLGRCSALETAALSCAGLEPVGSCARHTACNSIVQPATGCGQALWRVGSASARGFAAQSSSRSAPAEEQVQLSNGAVQRLQELQRSSQEPVVLRLTVEGGGCSGFQYEFSLDTSVREGDRVFERDGATVVMDDISFEFLKGATVDFESDLMRSAFVIQSNPNAASSCGCGSSFVAK